MGPSTNLVEDGIPFTGMIIDDLCDPGRKVVEIGEQTLVIIGVAAVWNIGCAPMIVGLMARTEGPVTMVGMFTMLIGCGAETIVGTCIVLMICCGGAMVCMVGTSLTVRSVSTGVGVADTVETGGATGAQ